MLVNLRNAWFDPDGNFRRVEDNPHEVADDWKDKLPSTAEVVSAKEAKAIKVAEEEEEEEEKEEETPKKK